MRDTLILLAGLALLTSFDQTKEEWLSEKQKAYAYFYQEADKSRTKEYEVMLNQGTNAVESFFDKPFPKTFDVYVHPTRASWDKKLQQAYQMPDFKSECWMVASGDGFQLNVISPVTWDTASCEHKYSDKLQTQQLLTHELFHVFHGQHNPSPDFMEFTGLDWLAEGFATYASGQLTSQRMQDLRELVAANKAPSKLDDFWKGKNRYGLAGSVVQYVDKRFGREMLFKILAFNTKESVLNALGVTEEDLVTGWKAQLSSH